MAGVSIGQQCGASKHWKGGDWRPVGNRQSAESCCVIPFFKKDSPQKPINVLLPMMQSSKQTAPAFSFNCHFCNDVRQRSKYGENANLKNESNFDANNKIDEKSICKQHWLPKRRYQDSASSPLSVPLSVSVSVTLSVRLA